MHKKKGKYMLKGVGAITHGATVSHSYVCQLPVVEMFLKGKTYALNRHWN